MYARSCISLILGLRNICKNGKYFSFCRTKYSYKIVVSIIYNLCNTAYSTRQLLFSY